MQRERNSFVAAWQDATPRSGSARSRARWTRARWTSPTTRRTGRRQVAVPDAELPRLTSGPAGTFLMYRSTAPATERQYFIRKIDGATSARRCRSARGPAATGATCIEDAGGILHALFSDDDAGLVYRASGDGGADVGRPADDRTGERALTIDAVRVAARSTDERLRRLGVLGVRQRHVAQPADHARGAAAAERVAASRRRGGPPAPPGAGGTRRRPGCPRRRPPGCRLLTFAAVDVIADACLKREGDAYVATGGVKINGLRIELGPGQLRLDTKKRTITSSGAKVTVKVGDTVLFKSAISWTLPKALGRVGGVGQRLRRRHAAGLPAEGLRRDQVPRRRRGDPGPPRAAGAVRRRDRRPDDPRRQRRRRPPARAARQGRPRADRAAGDQESGLRLRRRQAVVGRRRDADPAAAAARPVAGGQDRLHARRAGLPAQRADAARARASCWTRSARPT